MLSNRMQAKPDGREVVESSIQSAGQRDSALAVEMSRFSMLNPLGFFCTGENEPYRILVYIVGVMSSRFFWSAYGRSPLRAALCTAIVPVDVVH